MSEKTSGTMYESQSSGRASLDQVRDAFPDILELKNPEVERCVDLLTKEFGIKDSFFSGERALANTLLLSSVAANLANLEASGKTPFDNPADYEYIADSVMVIAMDHVTGFDELVAQSKLEIEGGLSDAAHHDLIDKFTSKELTDALGEKIDSGGLLDSVREKLGISAENEDPFELRVLSISSGDSVYNFEQDSEWPDYDVLPQNDQLTDEQRKIIHEQAELAATDSAARQVWENGLVSRRNDFLVESGKEAVAPAFVTHIEGVTYLCLAADTAELLAYDQDELRSKYYDERERADTLAYLHHEYTHTQGFIPDENLVGIGIEERRAEWFSGDHHGYRDIKIFFQDIRLTTGFDIVDSFESHLKGGGAEGVYADIATSLGLDMLVKIAAAYPKNYINEQSSQVLKDMDAHTGGYDGVIEELANRTIEIGGKDAMDKRLDESVDRLVAISSNPEDFILPNRENDSKYGTQLIRERIRQRKSKNSI